MKGPIFIGILCDEALYDLVPQYATEGSAGFDIKAAEDENVLPGECRVVKTGIHLIIPLGYEVQIRSRSGLASRGIVVANSPGTIDSDFRGEIGVIIHNTTLENFIIKRGDRIAQGKVAEALRASFVIHSPEEFAARATKRGAGGFGSTGTR